MTSINNKLFQGKFIFDIVLHVTILFTILSNLYILYIAQVSMSSLNGHLKSIINTYFNDNNDSIITSIKNFTNNKNNLITDYIKNNNLINNNLINNDLINNDLINKNLINKNLINKNLIIDYIKNNNLINNNLNYYNNIYSNQDISHKLVNQQIIKKIINVNILLIIITILFGISLLITKSITYTDIKHVLFENIMSFSIIGIIEFLFFTQIATQFVPSPPSHILHSLIKYLQN